MILAGLRENDKPFLSIKHFGEIIFRGRDDTADIVGSSWRIFIQDYADRIVTEKSKPNVLLLM